MSDSQLVSIEGSLRQETGKSAMRKLRKNGKIPANLMQKGKPSVALELDPKWLSKAWKQDKCFNLVLEGKSSKVKMHELQIDAVKRKALHVDLMYA